MESIAYATVLQVLQLIRQSKLSTGFEKFGYFEANKVKVDGGGCLLAFVVLCIRSFIDTVFGLYE